MATAGRSEAAVGSMPTGRAWLARLTLSYAVVVLVLVGVTALLGPDALLRPDTWQREATLGVALLSIAVLVADVVAPVPSSIVLVANGAIFGVVVGSVVSAAGLLLGALTAYTIGRRASPVAERLIGAPPVSGGGSVAGAVVVMAARPVPVAAEVTALVAGTTRMAWPLFTAAAAVGSLVTAVLFAAAGAHIADGDHPLVVASVMVVIGGVLYVLGRRLGERTSGRDLGERVAPTG